MPGKARVHEMASELGQPSKTILAWLKENGEFVKSASSTLEASLVRKLRTAFAPGDAGPPSVTGAAARQGGQPVRAAGPPAQPSERSQQPVPEQLLALGRAEDAQPQLRYSVDRLASWDDAVELSRQARTALEAGQRLVLDCSRTAHIYPNGCVPAAAAIQSYKAAGLDVRFVGEASYVRTSSLRNPLEASSLNLQQHDVFSRVWVYFDPEQASALARRLVATLEQRVECEVGVLDALSLCLYEALDNVFEHSQATSGFFMAQIHRQNVTIQVLGASA